jgi:KipI family sensor histidine kinase inhibitor
MSAPTVRAAGDRAALIEVADTATARRVADRLRAELPQLIDVVPGHCTVLATWSDDAPDLEAAVLHALSAPPETVPPASITIPVTYDGPDLAAVAELAGLSIADTVERHTAAVYTVGFLGFAPGFAYLLGTDPSLQVPRRSEPRTRVPAGSVAVAGPYSGIYPRESPGGWQLIGRTGFVPFDAARARPAALAPGDQVRFVVG